MHIEGYGRRVGFLLLVLTLVAASCGNGELSRLSDELDETRSFDDEAKACILDAAEQDNALLDALLADARGHSLEQRTDVALVQIDCTPEAMVRAFAAGQSQIWGVRVPQTSHQCFVDSLVDGVPDRRDRVRGIMALNAGFEAPDASIDPLVDIYVECLPSSVFLDPVTAGIVSDPLLARSADPICLETAVNAQDLRPVYRQLIEDGEQSFGFEDPEQFERIFEALFDCLSVGTMLAEQARGLDVELGDDTIACIDAGTAELPVTDVLNRDPSVSAQVDLVLDDCLSPEERAALPQDS